MRVLITGAAGLVGREISDELFGSHQLCLIDRTPVRDRASLTVNLARARRFVAPGVRGLIRKWLRGIPRWHAAFSQAEIVVHLAEEPDNQASWERVVRNNVESTWNVFEAAVAHGARRIVYVSSGWVVKGLELELAPGCYNPDGTKIDSAAPARPINPYGLGKALGELAGRQLVDENKLDSFVAVRLGWFNPMVSTVDIDKRYGISAQDLRALLRRCVETQFSGFHIVYAVSAPLCAPYDLSYTQRLLSWQPQHCSTDATLADKNLAPASPSLAE
jgi:UDP-glucose 4-epimerase